MTETLTKEMKRQAERRLASEVEQLMSHQECEMLQWTGSQIDLMEAAYVAFVSCTLQNDEGNYLSFIDIVRTTCSLLHVALPRNPYETAARGRRRKGLRNRPYLERYTVKVNQRPESSPFWEKITSVSWKTPLVSPLSFQKRADFFYSIVYFLSSISWNQIFFCNFAPVFSNDTNLLLNDRKIN